MDIQKEYMEAKDERMKTTAQTFNIIKTIKLYSKKKGYKFNRFKNHTKKYNKPNYFYPKIRSKKNTKSFPIYI